MWKTVKLGDVAKYINWQAHRHAKRRDSGLRAKCLGSSIDDMRQQGRYIFYSTGRHIACSRGEKSKASSKNSVLLCM